MRQKHLFLESNLKKRHHHFDLILTKDDFDRRVVFSMTQKVDNNIIR